MGPGWKNRSMTDQEHLAHAEAVHAVRALLAGDDGDLANILATVPDEYSRELLGAVLGITAGFARAVPGGVDQMLDQDAVGLHVDAVENDA